MVNMYTVLGEVRIEGCGNEGGGFVGENDD